MGRTAFNRLLSMMKDKRSIRLGRILGINFNVKTGISKIKP